MNWLNDLRLSARYGFVDSPFKPISTHALVPFEPDDLRKLPHTDAFYLGVEISQVFRAQRIKKCAND